MKNKKNRILVVLLTLILLISISILNTSCNSNDIEEEKEEEATTSIGILISEDDEYVEFGNYPQTEIVSKSSDSGVYGKAFLNETDYIIDEDLYNELVNLEEDKWDENGDSIIDGNKYRRIKESDVTLSTPDDPNYYNFESSDTYHYFKYEPIVWNVLKINENDAVLLSEKALDTKMYNVIITDLTWEESTIRSWLNGYDSTYNLSEIDYTNSNFIDTAFTEEEQLSIKETNLVNSDNIKNGTEGGNDTIDKVFLFSEDELYGAYASEYGFSNDYDVSDLARSKKSTTYAKAMGIYTDTDNDTLGNSFWWSRSPGSHPGLFILVRCNGTIYRGGQHANSKSRGVVPAIHVLLKEN